AELLPGPAVACAEGGQRTQWGQRAVAFGGGAQQPVPRRGVVPHAGQRLTEFHERLLVQLAGALPLHQAPYLLETGRRLVQVDRASLLVAAGHGEPKVLHTALEAVQGVSWQGVTAGRGYAGEGPRRHTDRQPSRGEPFGEPTPWPHPAQ